MTVGLGLSLLLLAAPAGTVEGTVHFGVKTLTGTSPTQGDDAVVFLEELEGTTPKPTEGASMAQKDKQFDPRLLVVMQGTKVAFPNEDLVYHNVFSLSKGNEFDLGVYRVGTTKAVKFAKPGIVDVFCNIHPDMIASVLVLQNPHFVKVGADGKYSLSLPVGKHALVAYWSKGVTERKEIEVTEGGKLALDFDLVDTGHTTRHLNKFSQQYGRYK